MHGGKAEIKSKKVKLQEKRNDKLRYAPKPIEISSEEEQQPPIPIQKRRPPANLAPQQQPQQYNQFKFDRLKKVEVEPLQFVQGQLQLSIQQNTRENPLVHGDARSLFSYRIQGNESTKYVSDLYLEQRIKKISEDNAKVQERKETDAANEKEEKQGDDAQEETRERNRPIRYFQSLVDAEDEESRLVKCFRCGKKGHIAKNCLQQRQQAKCLYCLGDHHHHDCNSRTCFKCNQQGHIAQECRSVGVECRRCHKMGHPEKRCGAIIFLDYSRIKADQQFRDRYGAQDLRKLRCLAGCKDPNGHFNCHQYLHVSKLTPYANYSSNNLQQHSQASKSIHRNRVEYEQRAEHSIFDRRAQRDYAKSYDRFRERRIQEYEDYLDYEKKPSWNSKKNHQNSNFDRFNDQYNINFSYHNQHQRQHHNQYHSQNFNNRHEHRRW